MIVLRTKLPFVGVKCNAKSSACLQQQQVRKHETSTKCQGELQGSVHQGATQHASQEQGSLQLNAVHSAPKYQKQNRDASLSGEDLEDLLESIPYHDQIIHSIQGTMPS